MIEVELRLEADKELSIKNYIRQQEILKVLQTERSVKVSELMERFAVTPVTIRRDLVQLEQSGAIVRSRGEASLAPGQKSVLPFFQRGEVNSAEKAAIARCAASLVGNNQSVILDSGTTTLAIAGQLGSLKNLTIITNSIPVSYAFIDRNDIEVRLCGGIVLGAHMALIGPDAEQYFSGIQVDACFVGASGVRTGSGFTTSSPFVCSIKQAMVRASKRVIAVVDSGKFSLTSIIEFLKFDEIDTLITTRPIRDEESLARLRDAGVEIVYAE